MALLLSLLAAACASSPPVVWENPDVPERQWSSDRAECRQRAQMQAEREFALDQQTTRTMNYDLGGQWAGEMNRFSAQQRQDRLFASCMTNRGYRQVPAGEPPEADRAPAPANGPTAGAAGSASE